MGSSLTSPTMKFFWRLVFIPVLFILLVACTLQFSYLVKHRNVASDVPMGEFTNLMEGMTFSSDILNNTVHLAMAVENFTSSFTLMKSVIIHTESPVHFHLIFFDDVLPVVVHTLMDSWDLTNLHYSLYSFSDLSKNLSWVPPSIVDKNQINDLIKLHLPSILPVSLDRIILLDDRLIMTNSVWPIWSLFLRSEIKWKPIAISRTNTIDHNQFDGAIIFFNLNVVRSIKWTRIWHKATKKAYYPGGDFTIILNTVIAELPSIHSFLPCAVINSCLKITNNNGLTCGLSYNISQSFFISARYPFKISDCKKDHFAHYRKIEEYVNMYDSVSLRRKPSLSKPALDLKHKKNKLSKSKICRTLREDSEIQYITRLFHTGRLYQPETPFDTTIVSQLSINRLSIFTRLLNQWSGPISITMYGNDSQVWEVIKYTNQMELYRRRNVAIHFVLQEGMFYPVNYLRNIALSNVRTKYVFLDDVDFLPSFGLHSKLRTYCKHLLNTDKKRALVIPAFETSEHNLIYPANKTDLLKFINSTLVTTYCPSCKHQTHAPTKYKHWYTSSFPYEIDWAYHFEPYVVVKSDVTHYSRRFMGYGWNKVSQITELKAQGYQFIVLPDHFIIHMPHKSSKDKAVWNMGAFKFCINRIWKRFVSELKHKYGTHSLTEAHDASIIFEDISFITK